MPDPSPSRLAAAVMPADELARLTGALTRFRSHPGQETPLAVFMSDWLDAHGIETELQEMVPGRANLIATSPGNGGGASVLFSAHLDVGPVSPGWTRDPWDGAVEDGWIYGHGVAHMKGSLSAMMAALVAIHKESTGPRGDVVLIASYGESDLFGQGFRDMLHLGIKPDVSINGEPTALVVQTGHCGNVRLRLRSRGREEHISRQDEGVDAIKTLVKYLDRLGLDCLTYTPDAALTHVPRVLVGRIEGGVVPHRTAARCDALVDVRTVPGMSARTVRADLVRLARQVAEDVPELNLAVDVLGEQTTFKVSHDAPVTRAVREAHVRATGADPRIGALMPAQLYASGAAVLHDAGIDTVIYGPGDWTTRGDQRVAVSEVQTAAQVYAAAAADLASRPVAEAKGR